MPFISADFLRSMLDEFQADPRPIFAGVSSFGFPFVLPKTSLPFLSAQIDSGRLSLQSLAKKLSARMMAPANEEELFNINTPAELKQAETMLRSRQITPILEVVDLTIRRGKTLILDRLNWSVQPGENWVILGANGSGKTSLLTALMGYLTPTSGVVRLLGKQYGRTDWRDLRSQVGLVSSAIRQMMGETEPALLSVVSGKYAQIDYWGKPKPEDRRRALKILEQVECAYLADRPWAYLSQGERQRILIGRALMAKPPVLILDEPCAGLDPASREKFLGFLQRLSQTPESPTLVLVTHHVEEIMPAFSHALILREGRALASGPVGRAMNSRNLSAAFQAPIKLRRRQQRFTMSLGKSPHWTA
jgi:iron complex transport system ATP-binding protein